MDSRIWICEGMEIIIFHNLTIIYLKYRKYLNSTQMHKTLHTSTAIATDLITLIYLIILYFTIYSSHIKKVGDILKTKNEWQTLQTGCCSQVFPPAFFFSFFFQYDQLKMNATKIHSAIPSLWKLTFQCKKNNYCCHYINASAQKFPAIILKALNACLWEKRDERYC